MRQLAQLGAMVVYESLMHWRRRVVTFLTVLYLIGLVGFSIFTADQLNRPRVSQTFISDGESVEVIETPLPPIETMEDFFADRWSGDAPPWIYTVSYEQFANDQIVILLLGSSLLPLFIGIPPLFSDTIPLDRQSKTRELLESLPLGKTVYLAGKVLGLWFCLTIGLLICAALYAVAMRLLFGVYDPLLYIALWGLIIIPASLVVSGFSILLASGVGTRRIAVLIGALLVPVGLLLAGAILTSIAVSGMGLSGRAPLSPASTYGDVLGGLLANTTQVIATFALPLPVLWVLAWLWTKWGDTRTPPLTLKRMPNEYRRNAL